MPDDIGRIETLIGKLELGDVRTCARFISRIEHGDADILPALRLMYRRGKGRRIVGVTGPPGAGKSTLIDGLIGHWRRAGLKVAVLAVDPSSPISGGAVLGDRLRMSAHGVDEGVFIRSLASRGQLGGLARACGDVISVLDVMPWDVILVETVGVGQNETDIMRHASVVVLLQTPMGGDAIQAAKAGVMEIGDIFVVNKSDHPDCQRTVEQLRDMISMGLCLHPDRSWEPPVLKTQATAREGIADLAYHINRRFEHLAEHRDSALQLARTRAKSRVGEILHGMMEQRLRSRDSRWLDDAVEALIARDNDPYTLAESLLNRLE